MEDDAKGELLKGFKLSHKTKNMSSIASFYASVFLFATYDSGEVVVVLEPMTLKLTMSQDEFVSRDWGSKWLLKSHVGIKKLVLNFLNVKNVTYKDRVVTYDFGKGRDVGLNDVSMEHASQMISIYNQCQAHKSSEA